MKKVLFSALALALLYGCASTPTDEAPGAAAPGTGTAPAAPVTTRPVQPPVAVDAGSSLKDPASALSKRSIFYELDKADIKDEYRPILQAHGKYLAERRGTKMLIQGNCDERGTIEYNQALGQRRAAAAKKYLTDMGVSAKRISLISYGKEKPVCTQSTEDCWQKNRRDDLIAAE